MNPGKLNKRVRILRLTKESDGAGGTLDNFETEEGYMQVAKIWAAVRPASASAKTIAQQQMSEISHEVLIRYTPTIQESDVVKYKNRRLDIQTVINIEEANKYMKLDCLENTNDSY